MMNEPYNGMPASELPNLSWIKSHHSGPDGNCVEFATLPDGQFGIRNSRDPQGAVLVYTRAEISALLLGARDGDFDHLLEQ